MGDLEMKRLRGLAVLVILLALTASMLHAANVHGQGDRTDSLKFRDEFGFSTDLALVDSLLAEDAGANDRWGVPLTTSEGVEMERRQAISDSLDALLPKLTEIAGYAGIYVDQRAGGVVDIAFVDDPESHRAAILDALPPNTEIRLRKAQRSWDELVTIQHEIRNDAPFWGSQGVALFSVSANVIANRVEVGVSDARPSIAQLFSDRYGSDAISLAENGSASVTSCTSRSDCPGPPFRGGLKITRSGTTYSCSNAFFVTQSGHVRYMTAGHCSGGAVGTVFTHPGLPGGMSTVKTNSYYSGTQADAATLGELTTTYDNDWVYRTSTTVWDIDTADTGIAVGDPVCLSGYRADATRCGTIVNTSIDVCINCGSGVFWLLDQVEVSYSWLFGDSGGAAHSGALAMGIQSGCVDRSGDGKCTENTVDRAFYSHILYAFNRLGGSIALYNEGCLPPAC
jgi:hypothetical protein